MITLDAAGTLAGKAGTASAVTYTVHGDAVGTSDSFKTLAQGQLASSAATIYTVPGSTQALIKQIHLANTTGSDVTGITFYTGGTAAGNQITGTLTVPANGTATYANGVWTVYSAIGSPLSTLGANGVPSGGSAGQYLRKSSSTDYADAFAAVNVTEITNAVSTARLINTTAPITGGGDLTADRTIAISAATASAAGSMSAADKQKLNSGWVDVTQQAAPVLTGNSGATNNTNLATIMTNAASGSVLYFPPGWYTFASKITIPAKVFIFQGSGSGLNGSLSAFTWTTNNADDWITQTASDYYMQFADIGFIAQAAQTAGSVINVNGNANNTFSNCIFTGLDATHTLFNGINFNGANGGEESIVYGCTLTNYTGTGIICNSNLSTVVIDSITINGGSIAASGVTVSLGGAVQLTNSDIIGCTNNLLINPAVSTVVASVFCDNTYFDNSGGSCIKITGAGATVRTKFNQCSFTTATAATGASAFECSSTFAYGANGQGLDIINCNVLNTFTTTGTTNGFLLTGVGDVRIAECNISGWTNGINVTPANAAGMTRPMIVNNTIGPSGNYPGNTTGIILNAGSFTYGSFTVQGNALQGNTTAITDNSTIPAAPTQIQKSIFDNTGLVSSQVSIVSTPTFTTTATALMIVPFPAGSVRAGTTVIIDMLISQSATGTVSQKLYFGTNGTTGDTLFYTLISPLTVTAATVSHHRTIVTFRGTTTVLANGSVLAGTTSVVGSANTAATTIANTSNSYLTIGALNSAGTGTPVNITCTVVQQ